MQDERNKAMQNTTPRVGTKTDSGNLTWCTTKAVKTEAVKRNCNYLKI